ncbi:MAG: integration host factor subunit beta [Elusimicrobiota bacterium]|jgi:nucleoid DNA-binding protein|nr:integration host factor subunit beta [Elusimicrobiota bacterium]
MNKNDIIGMISSKSLTIKQAKNIVDYVFEIIKKEALHNNNKVVISNFGTFEAKLAKKRIGRNPKTGEKVEIQEKIVLKFKPSKKIYKK